MVSLEYRYDKCSLETYNPSVELIDRTFMLRLTIMNA
jgi:hypothetical protein